jgi:hypothetical protein
MRTRVAVVLSLLLLSLLEVASCSPGAKPDTPEQFVEAMRKAYLREDVDTILALTADPALPPKGTISGPVDPGDAYDRDRDREELKLELRRKGMWYRAWCETKFVSAREHGDHVHVSVTAANVPTEVLLVRQDGVLKIHPRPGRFD